MATEQIIITFFGISFVCMAISWISFARISMARIEKDIKRDGLTRPASWDGTGARALWYSHAIVFPLSKWNLPNDPFFDVMTARRYSKPLDKTLGITFIVSSYSTILLTLVCAIFLDFN